MGILSDFIVADPTDAGAIDAATDRARWPTYQSKGLRPNDCRPRTKTDCIGDRHGATDAGSGSAHARQVQSSQLGRSNAVVAKKSSRSIS